MRSIRGALDMRPRVLERKLCAMPAPEGDVRLSDYWDEVARAVARYRKKWVRRQRAARRRRRGWA